MSDAVPIIRREGVAVNHKRVERLYREEGLSLRGRRRRKRLSHLRVVRERPQAANHTWAVDFVHDSLIDGRRFRVLTTIDEFSRESPALAVDRSLTGERVTRVLDRVCDVRGVPAVIQADNGPEFTSHAMDQWAYEHGVRLQFIEPGKPIQNAIIESFNSRLREECLNEHAFVSLDDARRKIEHWRIEYIASDHIRVSATWRPRSSRRAPGKQGTRPPHAALGQPRKCWPTRCRARRPRIQKLTVFRPTLALGEGWAEKLGTEAEPGTATEMNLKHGWY